MLGYFFLLHLILFKYHLLTFKCTHSIIFKAQEYLYLAIFEKPMIQVQGKTILSMEFKSIIKAHDLIHQKPNSYWQYKNSILIGNIKAQFSLAISKYNFSLAISKPNFYWQRAQDYQLLAKKKYYVTIARKDHDNHLMKKLIKSYLEDYVLIL